MRSKQGRHTTAGHSTSGSKLHRPTAAWMWRRPERIIALGFGAGLLYPAPGTWGTLAGWLLWWVGMQHIPALVLPLGLLFAFVLGWLVCQRVGRELGQIDHGSIVWDEIVAIWFLLWLAPPTFWAQLTAVVLFRFFDIVKPAPIRFFDVRLQNGFGVMWDDMLAAGYSALIMVALVHFGVLGPV